MHSKDAKRPRSEAKPSEGGPLQGRRGFTLIELLTTSSILLMVMLYVTQASMTQHKTYEVVE